MQVNFFVTLLKVDARARVLLSNKEKNLIKKILLNILLRKTSNQLAPIQQNTTGVASNEKLCAAYDSCIAKKDVIEVSETVPAQSAPSEFEAYLSSLDNIMNFQILTLLSLNSSQANLMMLYALQKNWKE